MFVHLEPVVDSKLSLLYQKRLPSKVTGKQRTKFQQTAEAGPIRKAARFLRWESEMTRSEIAI